MKNKVIKYSINNIQHRVTFCHDKEANDISSDLKRLFSDKKMLLIMDKRINKDVVKNLYTDLKYLGYKIYPLYVEGSKNNKNKNLLFKIIDELIKKKFTKKSLIISCGGGVVGDVSAMAASLYLRGMIYFHVPTTMTAIVDSCIGGKTGINYKNIINSMGSYYHPQNVFISKNIIELLPRREFIAGFAEIIKSGFLNDQKILNILKNNTFNIFERNFEIIRKIISLALRTKIKFFLNDVYENNQRLCLNFGHTFAHAVEMSLQSKKNDVLRHGEAVAIGMLCEVYYTEGKSKNFILLKKYLKLFKLPTNIEGFYKKKNKKKLKQNIYENIFLDKKKIGNYPRIISIKKTRKPEVIEMRSNKKILKTIEDIIFATL
jgi:3-dehydroquinate synthase